VIAAKVADGTVESSKKAVQIGKKAVSFGKQAGWLGIALFGWVVLLANV
jgi:hypothetical protein